MPLMYSNMSETEVIGRLEMQSLSNSVAITGVSMAVTMTTKSSMLKFLHHYRVCGMGGGGHYKII